MNKSDYLERMIQNNYGSINLQVIFTDIVKYSMRKSTVQKDLIEEFTNLTQESLNTLSEQYLKYAQDHNINFANDIIKIPTGDGLAIVFTFEGLQKIHLDFVETFLSNIYQKNILTPCEKFENEGWCNCHNNFTIRIGVSEGKGIIYKDVNDNYNVAGGTINTAARIMNLADDMQVLFSDLAYRNMIDMTTDTNLEAKFRQFNSIEVKHGVKLDIYQYCPSNKEYINPREPSKISLNIRMKEIQKLMIPDMQKLGDLKPEDRIKFADIMGDWMKNLKGFLEAKNPPK